MQVNVQFCQNTSVCDTLRDTRSSTGKRLGSRLVWCQQGLRGQRLRVETQTAGHLTGLLCPEEDAPSWHNVQKAPEERNREEACLPESSPPLTSSPEGSHCDVLNKQPEPASSSVTDSMLHARAASPFCRLTTAPLGVGATWSHAARTGSSVLFTCPTVLGLSTAFRLLQLWAGTASLCAGLGPHAKEFL
ncbi:hypothetical protein P7K49_024710 [Saguinus oedipus]|uniref:Uncharacterized protein n=1 Tax=Saguinus oedipus TaxID=9490 RepID=A0ABQ9UQA4_SAGOE|nr:hypothetical protein P7K49_024710 [Saguinus oedipus]